MRHMDALQTSGNNSYRQICCKGNVFEYLRVTQHLKTLFTESYRHSQNISSHIKLQALSP